MKPDNSSTIEMNAVLDGDGRIIAAVEAVPSSPDAPQCSFEPLPGQRVRTVKLPSSIASIRSGHDLHVALTAGRVDPDTGMFVTERRVERGSPPARDR